MNPPSWAALVIAVLVALIGSPILSAVFIKIRNRQMDEATAADIIQKAAGGLVTTLGERMDNLEKKSIKQEKEIENLRRGVRLLIRQLEAAGLVPVWHPGDPIPDDPKPVVPVGREVDHPGGRPNQPG